MELNEILRIIESKEGDKIKSLIASGDLEMAINQARNASKIDTSLEKDLILLSSEFFRIKKEILRRTLIESESQVALNTITSSLIEYTNLLDKKIRELAEEIQRNINNHSKQMLPLIDLVEKADLVVNAREEPYIREAKLKLETYIDSILNVKNYQRTETRMHFEVIFFIICIVFSFAACISFVTGKDLKVTGVKTNLLEIPLVINYILHISLISWMIFYSFKPNINVDDYVLNAKDFIKSRFNNSNSILKWFCARTNACIEQFGIWWKYLGFSFLVLYLTYFVIWCAKELGFDYVKNFESIIDIIINSSESFFLFILYRILTENTVGSKNKNYNFEVKLPFSFWQFEFITLLVGTFIFSIIIIFFQEFNDDNSAFVSFVFRALSSIIVSVALCMIIGKLDSKFINATPFDVSVLYTYAAIQLLFVFFDDKLISSLAKLCVIDVKTVKINEEFTKNIADTLKILSLTFVLILKYYFIQFVIKCYESGRLFDYFLLGSKFNDEMKKYEESKRKESNEKLKLAR